MPLQVKLFQQQTYRKRLAGLLQITIAPILFITSFSVSADKATVAVASNFTAAMKAIVIEFEKQTGHHIDVAYGSSGRMYAQISNGAPFDAFFSADQDKPKTLESNGFVVPNSRFTYAEGALALWSAKTNLDEELVDQLKQGRFNKIALANPRLAPYGAASIEVLEQLNLIGSTKSRWVKGENIAQTYQFVSTGNADLGFVALSQVMDNGSILQGSVWVIPNTYYQSIKQDAVLLTRGQNNLAAQELLEFVGSSKGKDIIKTKGYVIDGH